MGFALNGKLSLDASNLIQSLKKAQRSAEDVDKELKQLDDRKIDLEADTKQARAEVAKLMTKLTEVKGSDARAEVKADITEAKANIDRMQEELRSIDGRTAELNVEANGLDSIVGQLEGMPGQFGEIGSAISGIMTGPAGIAAGVGAIGAAAISLVEATSQAAIDAKTYADLTGTSVENASRLLTVSKQVGIEANDLSDITLQTVQGLQNNAEYAETLGINLADGKAPADRLLQVLGKMK